MFVDSSIVHSCPSVHSAHPDRADRGCCSGPRPGAGPESAVPRVEEGGARPGAGQCPATVYIHRIIKTFRNCAVCLNQVIFCRLQVWRRPEVPVSEAPEPA